MGCAVVGWEGEEGEGKCLINWGWWWFDVVMKWDGMRWVIYRGISRWGEGEIVLEVVCCVCVIERVYGSAIS